MREILSRADIQHGDSYQLMFFPTPPLDIKPDTDTSYTCRDIQRAFAMGDAGRWTLGVSGVFVSTYLKLVN